MAFAKLFSSITESSLWSEDKETRLMFVTMLAKADQAGFVEASLPGLARVANLSIEEAQAAITALESPDLHSKDLDEAPENEGRRIVKVPGGWSLVNYEAYRARRGDEERREYMRQYMREYRKQRKQSVNKVNHSKPRLAQAEAEAEAEERVSNPTGSQSKGLAPVERIYAAYPVKKGKKRALAAILRSLKRGADEDKILAAVEAFAKADSPKPHASTYFHQERWADEDNAADAPGFEFKDKQSSQAVARANPRERRKADFSKYDQP